MRLISPLQSRNARHLLSWHQKDLAKEAEVGIQTIRNFESGHRNITPKMIEKIRGALQTSGVEFLEDDGVKRRNAYCAPYSGLDSCDRLFEDITRTVKNYGGDVLIFAATAESLMEMTGLPRQNNLERLDILHELTEVRCVILNSAMTGGFIPAFEYQAIPSGMVALERTVIVFGNKYADIIKAAPGRFINVAYEIPLIAQHYRAQIEDVWDKAVLREDAREFRTQRIKSAASK
jgi:DNA-binding XRE family transcriptional regulator